MRIEQAIYGEMKGGHGLRAATGDRALAAELASRLDLPDSIPPGADWSPYVSGFPHRTCFVIARTFRDPNAPRAGMVLSHALIAPLDEIAVARDLRPVFRSLIDEPAQPAELDSLDIEQPDEEPPSSPELAAAAYALVTRGQGPVIRAGIADFEALIASIWWRLWPSIRRRFSFRLSFGPTDVVETPTPALICTPASLIARWREHRIVDRFADRSSSLAAMTISGEGEVEPLLAFAQSVGAEVLEFSELPLLEKAYRLAKLEPDCIGNTIAAIRLVERLSPGPARGEAGKQELINRLVVRLETASAADVLTLRNLSLSGFRHANRVWEALDQWLEENPFASVDDVAFQGVLHDALDGGKSSTAWRSAVLGGFAAAVRRRTKALFSALWRWAASDPALTEPLWEHIGASKPIEDGLVLTAPSHLRQAEARPIISFSAANGLYRLHGVTVAAAYPPGEAVRLQCSVEPASSTEGVNLSLKRAKPSEIVAAAIDVSDTRIVPIAGEEVAKDPGLLRRADPASAIVRAVWSAALADNEGAWRAFADARSAFDLLLEDMLDGKDSPPDLIERLSKTPLGDVSDFGRRAEIWGALAGPPREQLLSATSAAWLRQAGAGQPVSPVETALCDKIVSDPALDALLTDLTVGRVNQGVQVVATLSTFDEPRFRRWLGIAIERNRPLPPTHAEAIGRLVSGRQWKAAVGDLLRSLRSGREDLRPALCASISLVGVFDRWRLRLAPVTSTEKWDSLLEIAADLYPSGPDQDGLWERSGGRDADLMWGTGRSRWREALKQMRWGRGPRVDQLLREMKSDYGTNASLQLLSEDREFGGKR